MNPRMQDEWNRRYQVWLNLQHAIEHANAKRMVELDKTDTKENDR